MNATMIPRRPDEGQPWIDPTQDFEAFEFVELAASAKKVEHAFEDLTVVSPYWFAVEGDEVGMGQSTGTGGRRGGSVMFGDWRVDESLVEVFENQSESNVSDKQENMRVVDALLTLRDENGVKERQGLQECAIAFGKATEGDFDAYLDTLMEQCVERWTDEQQRMEAAKTGLIALDALTAARLEELGRGLKDHQHVVLGELKREREAATRKAIASTTQGSAHEENRLLFNKQLEETELQGKLKQCRRLLDVNSSGENARQDEVEEAMLQAARDRVENLMQVVEKMQGEQGKLSTSLQAEKRKVATLRRHISARLGISAKESREVHGASTTTKSIARGGSSQENLDESKGADADKDLKGSGIIDVDTAKDGVTRSRVGDRGVQPADGAGFSDVDDELHGVELLEACDRLEHDNLMLRQRLAKRELEVLQGEHEQEDDAKISDASLAQVLETKKRLQTELSELNKANAERSRELKRKSGKELPAKSNREVMANTLKPLREAGRTNSKEDEPESAHAAEEKEKIGSHLEDIEAETKALARQVICLKRRQVFDLACTIMKRRFKEAGLGPGNNPNPPEVLVAAAGVEDELTEVEGVPREMQGHAVLIQQKQAIEYEIERTVQEEQALIQVCERTGVRLDGLNENSGIGTEMVTGDGVSVGGEMSLPGEKNQAHGLEALHMKGDGQMMDGVEGRSGGERLRDVTPSESEAPGDDGQLRASAAGDDVGGFSLSTGSMKRKLHMARTKLWALRRLAEKTDEAQNARESLNDVDHEALQAVVRQHGIVRDMAADIVDILESAPMKRAEAALLQEAETRRLDEEAAKIPTPNERITEIPILDTIAPSHEGSERTRLPSDRAQPSSTKEPTATESATAKNIEATYSPSRGDGDTVAVHATRSSRESVEGSRKKNMGAEEPVAAIISTLAAGETDTPQQQHQRLPNTEKVKPAGADNRGAFANQDLRHDECEADDNGVEGSSGDVNHQDTSGASCMTSPQEEANALSIAATAEEATTVANDDEEKEAREREACAKLMKMRAEKQDIIRELRAKIAAAGGGRPRSMAEDLQKRDAVKAEKAAKKALRAREKAKRIAAAKREKDLALASVDVQTKREIETLKKQEEALNLRCEMYAERIRKLLLSKSNAPTSKRSTRDRSPGPEAERDPDAPTVQSSQQRKLTAAEVEKEKYLHSLTPQLERWRARVTAMTHVLEEFLAQRAFIELHDETQLDDTLSKVRLLTGGSRNSSPESVTSASGKPNAPSAVPQAEIGVRQPNLALQLPVLPRTSPPDTCARRGERPLAQTRFTRSREEYPARRGRRPEEDTLMKRHSRSKESDGAPGGRGGSGSGRRDGEADVAKLADVETGASRAMHIIAAELAGDDGVRSFNRVLREAEQLRMRAERPQQWLAQSARATNHDSREVALESSISPPDTFTPGSPALSLSTRAPVGVKPVVPHLQQRVIFDEPSSPNGQRPGLETRLADLRSSSQIEPLPMTVEEAASSPLTMAISPRSCNLLSALCLQARISDMPLSPSRSDFDLEGRIAAAALRSHLPVRPALAPSDLMGRPETLSITPAATYLQHWPRQILFSPDEQHLPPKGVVVVDESHSQSDASVVAVVSPMSSVSPRSRPVPSAAAYLQPWSPQVLLTPDINASVGHEKVRVPKESSFKPPMTAPVYAPSRPSQDKVIHHRFTRPATVPANGRGTSGRKDTQTSTRLPLSSQSSKQEASTTSRVRPRPQRPPPFDLSQRQRSISSAARKCAVSQASSWVARGDVPAGPLNNDTPQRLKLPDERQHLHHRVMYASGQDIHLGKDDHVGSTAATPIGNDVLLHSVEPQLAMRSVILPPSRSLPLQPRRAVCDDDNTGAVFRVREPKLVQESGLLNLGQLRLEEGRTGEATDHELRRASAELPSLPAPTSFPLSPSSESSPSFGQRHRHQKGTRSLTMLPQRMIVDGVSIARPTAVERQQESAQDPSSMTGEDNRDQEIPLPEEAGSLARVLPSATAFRPQPIFHLPRSHKKLAQIMPESSRQGGKDEQGKAQGVRPAITPILHPAFRDTLQVAERRYQGRSTSVSPQQRLNQIHSDRFVSSQGVVSPQSNLHVVRGVTNNAELRLQGSREGDTKERSSMHATSARQFAPMHENSDSRMGLWPKLLRWQQQGGGGRIRREGIVRRRSMAAQHLAGRSWDTAVASDLTLTTRCDSPVVWKREFQRVQPWREACVGFVNNLQLTGELSLQPRTLPPLMRFGAFLGPSSTSSTSRLRSYQRAFVLTSTWPGEDEWLTPARCRAAWPFASRRAEPKASGWTAHSPVAGMCKPTLLRMAGVKIDTIGGGGDSGGVYGGGNYVDDCKQFASRRISRGEEQADDFPHAASHASTTQTLFSYPHACRKLSSAVGTVGLSTTGVVDPSHSIDEATCIDRSQRSSESRCGEKSCLVEGARDTQRGRGEGNGTKWEESNRAYSGAIYDQACRQDGSTLPSPRAWTPECGANMKKWQISQMSNGGNMAAGNMAREERLSTSLVLRPRAGTKDGGSRRHRDTIALDSRRTTYSSFGTTRKLDDTPSNDAAEDGLLLKRRKASTPRAVGNSIVEGDGHDEDDEVDGETDEEERIFFARLSETSMSPFGVGPWAHVEPEWIPDVAFTASTESGNVEDRYGP